MANSFVLFLICHSNKSIMTELKREQIILFSINVKGHWIDTDELRP